MSLKFLAIQALLWGACLLSPVSCLLSSEQDEASLLQIDKKLKSAKQSTNQIQAQEDYSSDGFLEGYAQRVRHCANPPQKRYELLRDFVQYMAHRPHLRWTLGFGSLLGAMRQKPPGFIQTDDDLDIIMPARDLFEMHDSMILGHNLSTEKNMLGVITPNPTDDCCGFGWRLQHRDDKCAYMDFFIMSKEDQPYGHYGSPQPDGPKFWAIPRDEQGDHEHERRRDAMMAQRGHWLQPTEGEWQWKGVPSKYGMTRKTPSFLPPRAYLKEEEWLPAQQMQMYNLTVNIPKRAWDWLHAYYGESCGSHDKHGHSMSDPKWIKPSDVQVTSLLVIYGEEKEMGDAEYNALFHTLSAANSTEALSLGAGLLARWAAEPETTGAGLLAGWAAEPEPETTGAEASQELDLVASMAADLGVAIHKEDDGTWRLGVPNAI